MKKVFLKPEMRPFKDCIFTFLFIERKDKVRDATSVPSKRQRSGFANAALGFVEFAAMPRDEPSDESERGPVPLRHELWPQG